MLSLIAATLAAGLVSSAPPQRAADVQDGLGMNVHLEYTDSSYRDVSRVLACLTYLGVRHVRDAAPNPANQGQASYGAVARAGVSFDLFVNGEAISPAVKRLATLARADPRAISSVEGPNEINNHGRFNFNGVTDKHAAATAYQASLYQQIKADPELSRVPVLAFTDWPYTPGQADVENEHPYPPGRRAPGPGLREVVRVDHTRSPGRPVIFSELGFSTAHKPDDVSELAQSRLMLVSLLESWSLGVERVYVYQLLDAYEDAGGADHERHFGVFDASYDPKPAAKMLHQLTRLLDDPSPEARRFATHQSVLLVQGGPDIRLLRMQKADGDEVVAIWREVPVYDAAKGQDLEISPEPVDLTFRVPPRAVSVTDPVAATQGSTRQGAPLVRLALGADPVFVTIRLSDRSS